jgi:hypothetical protein
MRTLRIVRLAAAGAVALATTALADQPKMREALQELRQARQELEKADDNKGGHKARALQHIDSAIGQVQQGIDAADKNN